MSTMQLQRAEGLLHDLVAIPSVSGNEAAAVRWLYAQAQSDGLTAHIDRVGNLVIEVGTGPLHVLFVGHIDTVPGDLPVMVHDGAVWGRGSVDAKGSLIAAYEAIRTFRDSRDISITFVAAVREETDSRGVEGMTVAAPDVIINGEPSGWDGITVGYKGILRGHFRARARQVHGGHPDPGALDRVFAWWQEARERLCPGTGFDDVTMRLDDMQHAQGDDNVAHGAFQVRLPPSVLPQVAHAVLAEAASRHGILVDIDETLPAALGDGRDLLAACFRSAIRATGGKPRILRKTGTADFNRLAQWYPGVPIIAYGPGDSALDHTPEEHLPIADLERAIQVWRDALARLPDRWQSLK